METPAPSLAGKRVALIHPYPSVSILERIKAEGCHVVLVGGEVRGDLVEQRLDVSLVDYAAVEETLVAHHRQAPFDVVLPLYEGATALSARIAARLGLRGCAPAGAAASRNKFHTYERLRAAGVAAPRTIPVTAARDSVAAIEREIGYPAVIKLADSMNSQGVTRVNDANECAAALAQLGEMLERPRVFDVLYDRNRIAYGQGDVRLIAQTFCPGREVNVDLLFDEREHAIMGLFEKADSQGPYFPEHMSVSPTSLDAGAARAVCDLALAAVRATGLTVGAAHVEARYSEAGPMVLEIGARPGGGLTIDAVEALTRRHSVVELIRLLLGGRVPRVHADAGRAVLYGGKIYPHSGRLMRIAGVDEAKRLGGVTKFFQLHHEGDAVFAMPESAQPHFCYYLVEGGSRAEVLATHDRIRELIALDIQPR